MKKIIYIPILLFILTIISYGAEKEFRPQIEKVITSQFNAFKERRTYHLHTAMRHLRLKDNIRLQKFLVKWLKMDILISGILSHIHSKD